MKWLTEKVNNSYPTDRRSCGLSFSKTRKASVFISLAVTATLASACQTAPPEITSFTVTSSQPVEKSMPRLLTLSSKCLVGSGKTFANYRVSSELNSLSGQPRLLFVRRNDPEGLPGLVLLGQAKDGGTSISVFGRLLGEANARQKVRANVMAWAGGGSSCV